MSCSDFAGFEAKSDDIIKDFLQKNAWSWEGTEDSPRICRSGTCRSGTCRSGACGSEICRSDNPFAISFEKIISRSWSDLSILKSLPEPNPIWRTDTGEQKDFPIFSIFKNDSSVRIADVKLKDDASKYEEQEALTLLALRSQFLADADVVAHAPTFACPQDIATTYQSYVYLEQASLGLTAPTYYPRHITHLSRSATYIPGKGLMIHLKGKKRGLERHQIGTPSVQGVVTLAMHLQTGSMEAFKSMKKNSADVNAKSCEVHNVIKSYPNEFATGTVIEYQNQNKEEKIGIFMPFMEGGDLYNSLSAAPIDSATQISYALQVAKALLHFHELGYLHRDLKPDNLLLSADKKKIILADFDLAVKKDSRERYDVQGNRSYMAPEVFAHWLNGHVFDRKNPPRLADIVLRNIISVNLTQIAPSDSSKSVLDIIDEFRKISGNEITEKSEVFSFGMNLYVLKYRDFCNTWPLHPDSTSDPYEKIIYKCLQLSPTDRPTMEEVIQELEKLKINSN